ncbi:MAG TPA: thymidine phosphorylase [Acidimicrobiia bacterium]|nr:thymidine phosphorylase [Acidimicrobiia bacterium]
MTAVDTVEIIRAKRDGHRLTDDQITWFIDNYARGGVIADEQAAALAMAIFFRGMQSDELATWTRAMVDSGSRLDLSGVGRPTVDKHSTGGVGDKVSLILVPLVAACGAAVPQLSGRGLGHTGGTLDKMEAIPGWRASLGVDEMVDQMRQVGGVIAGATGDISPADRRLYALRDVTATVDSIPLIASSIMSKKIAEGTDSLVLDVKVGSGAFLPEVDRARELARTMVGLGESNGVRTVALLTAMHTVLGRTAGNALEVVEALEVLEGGGPADLVEVTLALADEMAALAGLDADPAAVLASGRPREVFGEMVAAQGGDLSADLPVAPHVEVVTVDEAGWLGRLDCLSVGIAAWRLGAGRARKEDAVSPSAGVVCLAKPGDAVQAGQPVLELHAEEPALFDAAREALRDAIDVVDEAPVPQPLIVDRIEA